MKNSILNLIHWRSRLLSLFAFLTSFTSQAMEADMKLGLLKSPTELNPLTYLSLSEWYVHFNITAMLVELDHDNQIISGLATKWTVTDEGTTYKFHLDTGRRWSDGSSITPQQILASLRGAVSNNNEQFLRKTLKKGPLEQSIYLDGEITLVIKLETTSATFLYHLAQPELGIIDTKSFVKTKTITASTRTSGDYKIQSLDNKSLTIVSNPYSSRIRETNPKSIEFIVLKDYPHALKLIKSGELDFYEAQSADAVALATKSGHYEIVNGGLDNLATLQARTLTPVQLAAIKVFARFFDKSLLVEQPRKTASRIVAYSMIPPTNDKARLSIEEAKQLLTNKSIAITMTLGDETTEDQFHDAEIIKREASKIGINIKIVKGIKNFRKKFWEKEDYGMTLIRMGVNTEDEVELMQSYFCADYPPYRSISALICDDIRFASTPGTPQDQAHAAILRVYEKINSSGKLMPLYHYPRKYLVQKKWVLKDYNNLLPFPIFTRFHLR